jgi:ACS family tartrate transporter-like MFS transporter
VVNWGAMEQSALERQVMSKVTWRLIPFMCLCYLVAFIDRSNVAVAQLKMGIREDLFGYGFGIFFLGYFLFEVPSNLIMEKVGARIWIARIMILWGFISSAFMLVGKKTWLFFLLRFLLGAGEAGFFPGMILYLTYWFPTAYRSRTVALFMTAAALSAVVGNPLSGALLKMDGIRGLAGWQWLFILEGIPAIILGGVVLAYLPNGPRSARWLEPEEEKWLTARLDAERAQRVSRTGHMTLGQALSNPKVLVFSILYFFLVIGGYGLDSFIPILVKASTGWTDDFKVSLLSAVPPLCAAIWMVIHGRHSDRTGERRFHVAAACAMGAVGLTMAALLKSPALVVIGLCISVSGRWSAMGPFWALPTAILSGTAAAGGIAMINSIGNLGGGAGPSIMGYLKKHTEGYATGMLILAACFVTGGILVLSLKSKKPEASEAEVKVAPADAKI